MLRHSGRQAKARAAHRTSIDTPVARPRTCAWWLAAAFLVKLTVLLQLRAHPLLQPDAGLDATYFVQQARAVLQGDLVLGPGLFQVSPFYVYWLAAALKVLAGSFVAVRVAQISLGTLAIALVFGTADAWFGRRAAFVAAAAAALTGLFTLHEVQLLPSALTTILTAASLAALGRALRTTSQRWLSCAGLLLGIAALNQPATFAGGLGVALVLMVRKEWRRAAVLAAALLIAVLPLLLRNIVVAGDLSPLSSHGGLSFYIGNNGGADGSYRLPDGIAPALIAQHVEARHIAERAVGRTLDDGDVSAYFYGLGWNWIAAHPVSALALYARKLAFVFNAANLPHNDSDTYFLRHGGLALRLLPVGPWLLLPLGLVGMFVRPSSPTARKDLLTWAVFVPAYALGAAAFYVASPQRLPILVPLCVTAAAAVDAGFRWLLDRRRGVPSASWPTRRIGLAVAGLIACGVLTNRPIEIDDGSEETQMRLALWLVGQGRYGEAEAPLKALEAGARQPSVLHYRMGRALLARNQVEPAIAHLQRALEIDSSRIEAEQALGHALLTAGRPEESIPHLRRAVDAGVHADVAGYDLARALGMTGDRAGALRALQSIRPSNPEDARVWFELGEVAGRLQAPRLAEVFYRRAIQLKNAPPDAHQQLGLTLAGMGRFDEAVTELEIALRADPKNATSHLNLAVALAETGQVDAARGHASDALRLRPGYDKARDLLAALSQAPAKR